MSTTSTRRRIAGTAAGLVSGWVGVFLNEQITAILFPFPAGTDTHSAESMKSALAVMPATAFAFVLLGWVVATFVGVTVARRVGHSRTSGWIVGSILLAGTVITMATLRHPPWVWVSVFILLPLATYAGNSKPTALTPADQGI